MHTYTTTKEPKKKACATNKQNKTQGIGIQVTFILEIKLHKYLFNQNITISSASEASILNWCQDGYVNKYATTNELKIKELKVSSWNIKPAIGIQDTFILEINLQKYIFSKV